MMPLPTGLLAELTYRCPLHCPYCSNPLSMDGVAASELTTAEWKRVLDEARALGVLQLHLSGGEPLQRRDLVSLVEHARACGYYINLITSGLGLSPRLLARLQEAGVDHIQISVQAAETAVADEIAGAPAFQRKISAARAVSAAGIPLTINVVLHRLNIGQVSALIELADGVQASSLELANTQYYGWALRNRAALLPTRAQMERAEELIHAAQQRLAGRMRIIYVLPDYYSLYPKPCMGGWARLQLTVTPVGDVLPCPTAGQIAGLGVENVRERTLQWIWHDSTMFNRFRGVDWMPDPCRSCPRRKIDFGGCRCQAFQVTGDAGATDPVCHLAPQHALIEAAVRAANAPAQIMPPLLFRTHGVRAPSVLKDSR